MGLGAPSQWNARTFDYSLDWPESGVDHSPPTSPEIKMDGT